MNNSQSQSFTKSSLHFSPTLCVNCRVTVAMLQAVVLSNMSSLSLTQAEKAVSILGINSYDRGQGKANKLH